MIYKPAFITFTGVDEHTSLLGMETLARKYPVEWGVLFSPTRIGGRYPPIEWVAKTFGSVCGPLALSAHLCGGHSRDLIKTGELSNSLLSALISAFFQRVQINTTDPDVNPARLLTWARGLKAAPILQCRGPFPFESSAAWLFDASGGRGEEPEDWPHAPRETARMIGYAGGLNPDNVRAHVERISLVASNYWIDMESGVRDDNDRFDLDKCRRVCEAVYGAR